jgi:hypothetical protein
VSAEKGAAQVSFEEKCEELTEMVSLPNWFSVDTKTGSIAVHLDFPQCFSAEVYAGDAGLEVPVEDEEIQSMFILLLHTGLTLAFSKLRRASTSCII